MVQALFENKGIDLDVYRKMVDQTSEINNLSLLSGLHQYMSDEDFNKVVNSLTVGQVLSHTINVNTAPVDVLKSLGISEGAVGLIVQERQKSPFKDKAAIPGIGDVKINDVNVSNYLTVSQSNDYTVYAYATVGGYTKQVEAIVKGNTFSYWRSL
jgi:type II secretory pathway component PulK